MFDWLADVPPIRDETHFGDRRMVRCFAERPRDINTLLAEAVARNPDGDAVVEGAQRVSWRGLAGQAAIVAAALRRRGVARGDRVLVLLGNRAEFVVATFALARLGAVPVPLSIRSQPPEIAHVLADCDASAAVVEDVLLDKLPPPSDAPGLRLRIGMSAHVHGTSWGELLSDIAAVAEPVHADEEDTAVILYTSGTTGRPKGAMLTHLNIVHSAMHYEACMALTPGDRSGVAVPLSHVTGLVAQLYAMARCAGAVVLLDAFKAPAFLELAERERMTHTVMVPAMYALCLLQGDLSTRRLSSWRLGAYGGAPMPPATIAAMAKQLPALLLMNAYGATETTSPTTLMPPGETERHIDSVGRPVPCAEVRIVDDGGGDRAPGDSGEIWIRGPMVVPGYWGNPAATAAAITDGWWHSGDVGRVDGDGFLQVLDRMKDLINRGGYKVYSSEVEAVLAQHPAVLEAAIVGRPCPVLGERVHAFVSTRDAVDADALRNFCAQRLSDYKVPETWTLLDSPLPRNANGKLQKRELRGRAGKEE